MKRSRAVGGLLGAAALMASLVTATPASAGQTGPMACSATASVTGATEASGQGTFHSSASLDHCGTLGVRVQYSSVGGLLWTGWRYSSFGGASVWQNVGNTAMRSQHTTTVNSLRFDSFR